VTDIREGVCIFNKYKLVDEPTEKMLPVLPYTVLAAKVTSIKIATLLPSIRNVPPLCVSLHAFVHWKHKNTHRTCRKRRRNTVRKDVRLTITRTHTCRCGEGKMINTTLHNTRLEQHTRRTAKQHIQTAKLTYCNHENRHAHGIAENKRRKDRKRENNHRTKTRVSIIQQFHKRRTEERRKKREDRRRKKRRTRNNNIITALRDKRK
jgi:hypothetical protein